MKSQRLVTLSMVNPSEGNRFLGWKQGDQRRQWMPRQTFHFYRNNPQWKIIRAVTL